jgi:hypothetical protein
MSEKFNSKNIEKIEKEVLSGSVATALVLLAVVFSDIDKETKDNLLNTGLPLLTLIGIGLIESRVNRLRQEREKPIEETITENVIVPEPEPKENIDIKNLPYVHESLINHMIDSIDHGQILTLKCNYNGENKTFMIYRDGNDYDLYRVTTESGIYKFITDKLNPNNSNREAKLKFYRLELEEAEDKILSPKENIFNMLTNPIFPIITDGSILKDATEEELNGIWQAKTVDMIEQI